MDECDEVIEVLVYGWRLVTMSCGGKYASPASDASVRAFVEDGRLRVQVDDPKRVGAVVEVPHEVVEQLRWSAERAS